MRRFVRVLLRVSGSYLIFISLILVVFLYLLHLTSREVVHMTHIRTYTQPPHIQEVDQCKYPHNYYVPWYKSSELYRYFQLVFYKKQKMGNAITVARNKGWSVSGIIKSRNKLDSIVKGNIFTVLFTSSKELSSTLLEEYANKTNMLSTGILGAYQFTGSKKEQYLTYQQYLNRFRCSIEELKFMPVLYLLDNGNHCRSFFEKLKAGGEQGLWVLKNSRGYGGDQVQVVHNTSLLTARFGSCKNNEEFIVQEYIQSLLLLDNRKFDVRALVLIAGTQPYLLFYHHGYLRVVLKQFDLKASREVHLTNTHVQSQQPGFSPEEHFWSFTKFQSYLDQHYPDNGQFVHEKLIPHIKRTSLMILKSGLHLMRRAPSTFQLLGLDLMVTTDWHIWFIESNNYPLWPQGGWITDFTSQMGEDMFDLTIAIRQKPETFLEMPEGDWYHSWQLVWREKPQECEQEDYNPCNTMRQN